MGNCFLYKRGGSSGGGSLDAFTKTVMGKFITLTDSAAKPFKGLRVFGKTTQNGTPTPDAPVPLNSVGDSGAVNVTVCGKNLYDISKYPLTQGFWITANGTVSSDPVNACTESYIPVTHLKGNTFTLNKAPGGYGPSVAFYDANQGFLSAHKNNNVPEGTPLAFNVPENAVYMRFCTIANDENIQIEIGSTATEYEPYTEQTLPISTPNGLPGIPVDSGGNYTDENGQQWICDEVDFAKGVYVKRIHNEIYNGTEGWMWENGQIYLPRNKMGYLPKSSTRALICSHFKRSKGSPNVLMGNNWGIMLQNHTYTNVNEWIAWLAQNPITVEYEIETPTETPLSAEELAQYAELHTNLPNTIIYNDAGADMEVKYTSIGG